MKKTLFILSILVILISQYSLAQVFVGDPKGIAKFFIKADAGKYRKTSIANETDSSFTYMVRGDVRPMDIYVHFKKGWCDYQKVSFDCDSCFEQLLQYILKRKIYKWRPWGSNGYLAKSTQILLQVNVVEHYFTITHIIATREEYKKMLAQAGIFASK